MSTKRIPALVVLLLLFCGGLVYAIGSFRPLAPSTKFENLATSVPGQDAELPTEAEATAGHSPTPAALTTRVAQVRAVVTEQVDRAIQNSQSVLTSVPALKTYEAIAARARATRVPSRPSGTPRAIARTTNILLLGTDTRTSDPNWKPNTDVIMMLFLDTANQRAGLVSFPRDLVVAIPGHQAFRINYAYHYGWEKGGVAGGVALLKQIFHDDLDVRVDHWALVDFSGLNKIIDTLGGIQVQVPCELHDTIDDQAFTIPAGAVQMDYLTAKRYVQSRYTTSDTSRNYRQQRVVWAMAKKGLELNAPDRVPVLYDQLKESVATDMTVFDLLSLVPAVYQLDLQSHPERVHARVLEQPAVYPWVSPSGAWLFMPNYMLIQKELDTLFDAPPLAGPGPAPSECPARAATPPPTDLPAPTAATAANEPGPTGTAQAEPTSATPLPQAETTATPEVSVTVQGEATPVPTPPGTVTPVLETATPDGASTATPAKETTTAPVTDATGTPSPPTTARD